MTHENPRSLLGDAVHSVLSPQVEALLEKADRLIEGEQYAPITQAVIRLIASEWPYHDDSAPLYLVHDCQGIAALLTQIARELGEEL